MKSLSRVSGVGPGMGISLSMGYIMRFSSLILLLASLSSTGLYIVDRLGINHLSWIACVYQYLIPFSEMSPVCVNVSVGVIFVEADLI